MANVTKVLHCTSGANKQIAIQVAYNPEDEIVEELVSVVVTEQKLSFISSVDITELILEHFPSINYDILQIDWKDVYQNQNLTEAV